MVPQDDQEQNQANAGATFIVVHKLMITSLRLEDKIRPRTADGRQQNGGWTVDGGRLSEFQALRELNAL
jgi:hypothetical protein